MGNIDEYFYKYRAFNSNSLLMFINRELYFAKPEELNDPHDCKPIINHDFFEKAYVKATIDPLLKDILPIIEKYKNEKIYLEKVNEKVVNFGVFSLSKINNDVRMWSYYADSHKGFCVKFNFSDKFRFPDNNSISQFGLIGGIIPCEYNEDIYNAFYKFLNQNKDSNQVKQQYPEKLLLIMKLAIFMITIKSQQWGHESEFRMIKKEYGLINFLPNEIVEIIFGLNIKNEHKKTIINLLSSDDWKHIKFSQAMKNDDSFNLRIEPFDTLLISK